MFRLSDDIETYIIQMPTLPNTIQLDNGKTVAVELHIEQRRNIRYALGKKGVILRLPKFLSETEQHAYFAKCATWVRSQFVERDDLSMRIFGRSYTDGCNLTTDLRDYTIRIVYHRLQSHTGKIILSASEPAVIELRLAATDTPEHTQESIRTLLSRIVAADQKQQIWQRVVALNDAHFGTRIAGLKLSYNTSNWGSCSRTGNINLSTRLLFAPATVRDYVIIHELAHRIEFNHSPRFWALVARAMPEYEAHERWLKEYGASCHF